MLKDSSYEEFKVEEDESETNNLTINNFLNPGESTSKTPSILHDTMVRVQNDSDSENGCLLVKGFNKNFKKVISPSSFLEFRLSGTLMSDQFINIGNTRLIISIDGAKDTSFSNTCKLN